MPRPSVQAERREQILASTCTVIAERGITALRVADVAKHAGLSPGIIHYYFDNKRDLTHAAFEQNFVHSLERRARIFESDLDAVAKIKALADDYLPKGDETVEAWHVWAELWVAALHDKDLQDLNERAYGEWRRIIAGLWREAQSEGQIGAADPVDLANRLVGLMDGLALQVLMSSRAMTLSRMRKTCRRFIDDAVSAG
ncbi:MAG: TetR/AcrR family transcriptional regulator [Nocardioidaceae bacterium]